jgi:prepilin-type N-terminal cleavage/methylation domain-containing protein
MRRIGKHVSGFTLIELLVVIAIITVLAGLLFPAFETVLNSAKKTGAKNDLTQLVTAVTAFYTEYGKYPTTGTTDATATYGPAGSNTNEKLLDVLRNITTDPLTVTLNPRQIVFISPSDVKDVNHVASEWHRNQANIRPQGTPYNKIDGNYDNQLANPYAADSGAGPAILNIGVIAWSFGSDGQLGTAGDGRYKTTATPPVQCDDMISWQ